MTLTPIYSILRSKKIRFIYVANLTIPQHTFTFTRDLLFYKLIVSIMTLSLILHSMILIIIVYNNVQCCDIIIFIIKTL